MRSALPAFLLLLAIASGVAGAADDKKKPVRPPTRQTQVIRPETYKKMEVAQKAFEAKDYKAALASLDELKSGYDKLNDYEKATLWSLYAAAYYAKGDNKSAIEAYNSELKQPNLPEGLRDNSLYALAQLYFITEDYDKVVATVKQWMSVVSQPQPDGYVLIAQAYYQKQRYKDAEASLIDALKLAKQNQQTPKENWLALLRAVYYELKDYAKSAKVLEALVSLYPGKPSYWQQLAGMYGLLDRQPDQLKISHAAYRAGLLTSEPELLNLARLYLVREVPYPAVEVLTRGMKANIIKTSAENLQLYAQALALAKEYDKQIPVLKQLAEMTGDARHYVYLGQAYAQLNQWNEAAGAFKQALDTKGLDKPDDVRVQLGTALYNANKLAEAREAFAAAARSPAHAQMAGNWVKFVGQEIQRKNALGSRATPKESRREAPASAAASG